MSSPRIAGKKPIRLELEPGTYFFCTCGESSNQPFCDGSHQGSEFKPQKFEIVETCTQPYCACKRSAKAHICDGSHKTIE